MTRITRAAYGAVITVTRSRSDSARTREQLLDAAERLIAAQGIASVSLRMINAASGARNVSAAHYHFGSKDGVIEALWRAAWGRSRSSALRRSRGRSRTRSCA